MIAEITTDSPEMVEREVSSLELQVNSLVIVTAEDHESACALEKRIGAALTKAKGITQPAIEAARESLEAARKVQSDLCGPLERAKPTLRAKIGAWKDAERRRIEEANRAAAEAASRLMEDEALDRAARLERAGAPAAAMAALDHVPVVATFAPIAAPQSHGVSVRKTWSAEVEDLDALILWVSQDIQARKGYLFPSLPALNAQARSLHEALNIPGVRPTWRFS